MIHGFTSRDVEIAILMLARLRKKGLVRDDEDAAHFDVMKLNGIYGEEIGPAEYQNVVKGLDKINQRNPSAD